MNSRKFKMKKRERRKKEDGQSLEIFEEEKKIVY